MLGHFVDQKATRLLFDVQWWHTKQSIPYLPLPKKKVSMGWVKWIPNSKATGKDNCCWYLFSKQRTNDIKFYGR
mgnify:CR=1 FL=1